MNERAYERLDRAAKVAVWVVLVPMFVLAWWYIIDRFATLGVIGSLFTVCAAIAFWAGHRRRR